MVVGEEAEDGETAGVAGASGGGWETGWWGSAMERGAHPWRRLPPASPSPLLPFVSCLHFLPVCHDKGKTNYRRKTLNQLLVSFI